MDRTFDNSRELSDLEYEKQWHIDDKAQLSLTIDELEKYGLKEYFFKGDELNKPKLYYQVAIAANTFVYYNPKEEVYKWYLKTVIGDFSNHVLLNIQDFTDLDKLLILIKQ